MWWLTLQSCSGVGSIPYAPKPAAPRGHWHTVASGETLFGIAAVESVPLEDIAELNGVEEPWLLEAGRALFIPEVLIARGAGEDSAPDVDLQWPLCGRVSSEFGPRDDHPHEGMDIAATKGTPLHAALAGSVVFSGWQRGYGRMLILKHAHMLLTVYAHTSANLVDVGDAVTTETVIAKVGSSGRSTGPHVHFEVRRGVKPLDPRRFLGTCR